MSIAVLTPPAPAASLPAAEPKPYRWTIARYRELDKTGLFYDVKTMLIDGELYVMPMPSPPHDISLNLADGFLRSICPPNHHVRNQQGFDIGLRNDPGPDLALVVGTIRDYTQQTPTTALLVIEVAVSSLAIDTNKKAELYAAAGVADYWVIDVDYRQLHIFRDPVVSPVGLGANAYRTRLAYGPTDTVAPLAVPTATVKVSDLLP
jgi:Uma2 family endonuclease